VRRRCVPGVGVIEGSNNNARAGEVLRFPPRFHERKVMVYMSYTRGCAMTVTVRLTAEEEARLEALSQRTGRTKSFYVRAAIRAYLEDLEDAYAADDALKDFEASGRKSRPLGRVS